MNGWIKTSALMLLALCLNCSVSLAKDFARGPLFKGMDLTAGQKQQVQALFENQMADEKKDFDKIKEIRGKMDEEFLKDRPDESKIKSDINDIEKIQSKLLDEHFDRIFALRKILTPEQFKKFIGKSIKMRKDRGEWFKGFWQSHRATGESSAAPDTTK